MVSLFNVAVQPHDGACNQGNSYRFTSVSLDVLNALYIFCFVFLLLFLYVFILYFKVSFHSSLRFVRLKSDLFLCDSVKQKHNQIKNIACGPLQSAHPCPNVGLVGEIDGGFALHITTELACLWTHGAKLHLSPHQEHTTTFLQKWWYLVLTVVAVPESGWSILQSHFNLLIWILFQDEAGSFRTPQIVILLFENCFCSFILLKNKYKPLCSLSSLREPV